MEYCPGGSLGDLVQSSAGVQEPDLFGESVATESRIRGIIRVVTEGLIFIHDSGLQHSEITLANIFLAFDSRIVSTLTYMTR